MLIRSGLPCNNCGSSDALAQYDNGNYCFSCGESTRKRNLRQVATKLATTSHNLLAKFPVEKGSEAWKFLKERHFTEEQIYYYNIWQSEYGDQVYFLGDDFVEIRFLLKDSYIKYMSQGNKDNPFIGRKSPEKSLIIVEDILSCMRVGWNYPCLALRGTKLNHSTIKWITSATISHITLWLDDDLAGQEAVKKIIQQLNWTGIKIETLCTKKDPKMYTDKQIDGILNDRR